MHRQFMLARRHPKDLRAGFLTHFHSDHMTDVYPFFSTSYYYLNPPYAKAGKQVTLYGPPSAVDQRARRHQRPRAQPDHAQPGQPDAGLQDMMRAFVEGPYAYDNNLRIRDEGMPDLLGLAGGTPQLLLNELPAPGGAHWQNLTPAMDPAQVYEDELVRVTAILVDHPPMFPAYAFRFETPDGSITISGDTTASENLIKLAKDTDVLVHEVIHTAWLDWRGARRAAEAARPSPRHRTRPTGRSICRTSRSTASGRWPGRRARSAWCSTTSSRAWTSTPRAARTTSRRRSSASIPSASSAAPCTSAKTSCASTYEGDPGPARGLDAHVAARPARPGAASRRRPRTPASTA